MSERQKLINFWPKMQYQITSNCDNCPTVP